MRNNFSEPDFFIKPIVFPKDKESSLERRTRIFLERNNVRFRQYVTFDGCKYKRNLIFDFVVYKAEEIAFVLELDGAQHDKPVEYFGGEKAYQENKNRDNIKERFCESEGMKLFRFKQLTDKNLTLFLENTLKEFDLI